MRSNRYVMIGVVVFIGIVFQLILYWADQCDCTPTKAAVRFTEAYLKLDDSMSQLLCQKYKQETDGDAMSRYLEYAVGEARAKGLNINMMRSKLYNLKTEIISQESDKAQIKITGDKKVYVNPVYAVVANIFDLGQTDPFDEVINVVKENNRWKVCKDPLNSFL